MTLKHVLTAAHCLAAFEEQKRENVIKVRCGDFNLQLSDDDQHVQVGDVANYDLHDRYQYGHANYDVAILHMQNQLSPSESVRPICLEDPNFSLTPSDSVFVTGWGEDWIGQIGGNLKVAQLQILEDDYCENSVGKDIQRQGVFGQDLFCADDLTGGISGSCHGDSGGPVFSFNTLKQRFELTGLVNGGKVCGAFGLPDVYTKTSFDAIHQWIVKKISGCLNGHLQCLDREECPYIKNLYKHLLQNAGKEERRTGVKELKSLVCEQKKRTFCCSPDEYNIYGMGPNSLNSSK